MRRNIGHASGCHEALRAIQSAAFEFEPEKARGIDEARKRKPKRMAAGKPERLVIRRVADEQDSLATVRRDLPTTPAKAGVCTSKFEIKVIRASAGRCRDCTRRPSQTGERSIVERLPAVRDRD
jgi:hypothetical protein